MRMRKSKTTDLYSNTRFMIDGFRRLRFVVADPEMSAGGLSVGVPVYYLPIFPKTPGIKNGPRGEGPRESPLNPYTGQVLLKAF